MRLDANGTPPTWLPSGTRVAYLQRAGAYDRIDGTLVVVNAVGSGRVTLLAAGRFSLGLTWSATGAYVLGRSAEVVGRRALRATDAVNVVSCLPFVAQQRIVGAYGDDHQPDWR